MQLFVSHSTRYVYDSLVTRSTQYIRLTPGNSNRQKVHNWSVTLPVDCVTMNDSFGNHTHVLTFDAPHDAIEIKAVGQVDVNEADEGEPAGPVNPMAFLRFTPLTRPDAAIKDFVSPFRKVIKTRPLMGATELMGAVLDKMPYTSGSTSVESSAAQAFALGKGVCQDHSHVFLSCCRELDVAARYVSGYVYSSNREEVASHAWVEAWIGGRWVSFDISNAKQAGGAHIKLAVGLDYSDACPVRGVRTGGGHEVLSITAQVNSELGAKLPNEQ
jgi:transglutaminase-like putative cysteine protease